MAVRGEEEAGKRERERERGREGERERGRERDSRRGRKEKRRGPSGKRRRRPPTTRRRRRPGHDRSAVQSPHSSELPRAPVHALRLASIISCSSDAREDTNSTAKSSAWGARGREVFLRMSKQRKKKKANHDPKFWLGSLLFAPPRAGSLEEICHLSSRRGLEYGPPSTKGQTRGRMRRRKARESACTGGGRGSLFQSSPQLEEEEEEERKIISSPPPSPRALARATSRYVLGGERSHGDDGRRARGTDAADRDGLEGGEGGHGGRG